MTFRETAAATIESAKPASGRTDAGRTAAFVKTAFYAVIAAVTSGLMLVPVLAPAITL